MERSRMRASLPRQLAAKLYGVKCWVANVFVVVLHQGRCVEGHHLHPVLCHGRQRLVENGRRLCSTVMSSSSHQHHRQDIVQHALQPSIYKQPPVL